MLSGRSKEAAERFQRIKDTVVQNKPLFDNNFFSVVREYLAISYLRMGEQDNCISRQAMPAVKSIGLYCPGQQLVS